MPSSVWHFAVLGCRSFEKRVGYRIAVWHTGSQPTALFPEGPWELLLGKLLVGRAFLQACGGSSLMVEDTTSPFTLSWTIALSFRLFSPECSERKESLISQGAMLRQGDAGKASFACWLLNEVFSTCFPSSQYLLLLCVKCAARKSPWVWSRSGQMNNTGTAQPMQIEEIILDVCRSCPCQNMSFQTCRFLVCSQALTLF